MQRDPDGETTFPLRAASRLTGLSPELLRAWERRYGVVEPLRTPGGTRRYRAADLERLCLVKAAVDAGHRIGEVATLDAEELQRRASRDAAPAIPARRGADAVIDALERLDASEAHRLLSIQLSTLGPVRFAQEYARPLVHEIGDRWATERLSIASEHLATGVLRSLLGSALVPDAAARTGPVVVFATLSGERHELGLQMAALTAMGAGACPLYLGAELPVESILGAVERAGAAALGLSLVTDSGGEAARTVRALRAALPPAVPLWLGGSASREIPAADGIERIEALDELERRVARLGFEQPAR